VSLPVLNFPPIDARFQNNEAGVMQVFDMVRRKFVVLSPEEWVRQHLIHYLIYHKEVPMSMVSVEKQLMLNGTRKRTDVVVFHKSLKPLMIIECKAPSVVLDQNAVNQILRYNLTLNVPYLFISNGRQHICLKINGAAPEILKEIPLYPVLTEI
jgi:predicted type IV restriction endonuclease